MEHSSKNITGFYTKVNPNVQPECQLQLSSNVDANYASQDLLMSLMQENFQASFTFFVKSSLQLQVSFQVDSLFWRVQ